MVVDSIADLFTRIRNSLSQKHESVMVRYSVMNFSICQIFKDYGFINAFEVLSDSLSYKSIKITLKYRSNGNPMISKMDRVSKSSRRIYVKKCDIPKVLNGFGLSLVSTSKGILSGKDARLKNVGGELLGIVW